MGHFIFYLVSQFKLLGLIYFGLILWAKVCVNVVLFLCVSQMDTQSLLYKILRFFVSSGDISDLKLVNP